MLIRLPRGWEISENSATPEEIYHDRRHFLKQLGFGVLGAISGLAPWATAPASTPQTNLYPAKRNSKYSLDRAITDEYAGTHYNNFYEFTTDKKRVADLTGKFQIEPWTVEIKGLVAKPQKIGIEALIKLMPVEERLYRFRCVEAWSMAVPWTGFSLQALLELVEPTAKAKFVRMVSFNRPGEAPGMAEQPWYPWPYCEGLRLDEARNELAFMAIGMYGKPLPKQNGAPIRLVVPWKYGYKSIKSIVAIELTDKQPPTFWNQIAPSEYDFLSNVDPQVPHPRWSQAKERVIPGMAERPTLRYNGYEEFVAHLYKNS